MRFKGLDLNLIVALQALLTTRSIARAAERMNLSQPAMSAALGRLRTYFQDDLLILDGKKFYPTSLAIALLPLVAEWLRDADAIIAASLGFEPTTSQRVFRIIASDYISVIMMPRLAAVLSSLAPCVRLDLIIPEDDALKQMQEGSIDLLIGPERYALPDHPSEVLFEEKFVVAGWSENPVFQRPLSETDFAAAGHVVATFGPQRVPSFGDQFVDLLGIRRRVEASTSSFAAVPWLLIGTMRLGLMHERLARFFAAFAPLRFADPPFAIPPIKEKLQYHRARQNDAGLIWMREKILWAAKGAGSQAGSGSWPSTVAGAPCLP